MEKGTSEDNLGTRGRDILYCSQSTETRSFTNVPSHFEKCTAWIEQSNCAGYLVESYIIFVGTYLAVYSALSTTAWHFAMLW